MTYIKAARVSAESRESKFSRHAGKEDTASVQEDWCHWRGLTYVQARNGIDASGDGSLAKTLRSPEFHVCNKLHALYIC